MSRQVKSHVARSVSPSAQGITASAHPTSSIPVLDHPTQREDERYQDPESSDSVVLQRTETTNGDEPHDQQIPPKDLSSTPPAVRHRTKPVPKPIDRTLMIMQPAPPASNVTTTAAEVTMSWTQLQQKQLESALNQVPKGAADRWDRIAELVPDRTKVFHFRQLVEWM